MSIKQPGKNYNNLASSIATLDNLAKIEATNGHNPELNLKSVIEWLFKTATASEVNAIELVSKLVT